MKQALDKLKITNSLLIALYHDYLTEYQNAPEVLRSLQKALLSIAKSSYSLEQKEAYLYAFLRGITTMPTIQEAMLDRGITRAEMAKMMSVYAQTVLKKQIIRDYPAIYTDVHGMQGDLPSYINLAYQLQLMGIEADGTPLTYFLPYGEVSRAEF